MKSENCLGLHYDTLVFLNLLCGIYIKVIVKVVLTSVTSETSYR
jgi:hypothetical protein